MSRRRSRRPARRRGCPVLHAGGEQRPRRRGGVADDGDVDRPVRAERVRVDVDLDHLRARGDERAVARRPAGERGAEGEHQVGLRDQPGGDRRGEAAGDADRPRRAGEQPVAHRRGGEHGADRVAERLQRLARAGEHRAAAGDDDRPPRGGDQLGDLRDGGRRRGRARAAPARMRRGRRRPAPARAWTSSGMLSTTGRRSTCARRSARAASAAALAPEWMRSGTAPRVVASAAWSTRKFERSAAAAPRRPAAAAACAPWPPRSARSSRW